MFWFQSRMFLWTWNYRNKSWPFIQLALQGHQWNWTPCISCLPFCFCLLLSFSARDHLESKISPFYQGCLSKWAGCGFFHPINATPSVRQRGSLERHNHNRLRALTITASSASICRPGSKAQTWVPRVSGFWVALQLVLKSLFFRLCIFSWILLSQMFNI